MPPQKPLHEESQGQAEPVIEITVIVPPNVKVKIQERSTNASPETETRQS
jgi:hypothetical protein